MSVKSELHTLRVNNTELHYQEAGKGDLLVLVHGTLGDYRTWRRQLSFFSKHFHVVAYSRRFHFPNVFSPEEYSVEIHTEDLAQLIQHFAKTSAHVVTASWGGNVGLQLALCYSPLVRSLVLAEPPTLPLLAKDVDRKSLLDEFNRNSWHHARLELLNDNFENGIRIFIDGVMGEGSYDSFPPRMQRFFLDNAKEMKAEAMSTNYIPDFSRATLNNISVPVLLLGGDRSPLFFHAILDLLESCLPHSERHRIANASHGIHADNATMYNQHVLGFLLRC